MKGDTRESDDDEGNPREPNPIIFGDTEGMRSRKKLLETKKKNPAFIAFWDRLMWHWRRMTSCKGKHLRFVKMKSGERTFPSQESRQCMHCQEVDIVT